MARFIVRRLIQSAILLVIVSVVGFAILNLAPGGPLAAYALNPNMTQADMERLKHQLGLDQPLPVQYGRWVSGLAIGDWGRSYRDSEPVLTIIAHRLPATLELMVTAEILAVVLGTLVGILGAVHRYSIFDYLATIGAMAALSLPTFWFGLMVIFVFSVKLGWLPPGNIATIGDGSLLDRLRHLIAPAVVLALVTVAIWSRYTRSSMIDVINQDYIRTARAKGLRERQVIWRHGVRAAITPVVTALGIDIGFLLGGAVVVETVFNVPGVGRLAYDGIHNADLPIIQGTVQFGAFFIVIANLIVDVAYAFLDPRVRYS